MARRAWTPPNGWPAFDHFIAMHLTLREIADYYGVCQDAVERSVRDHIDDLQIHNILQPYLGKRLHGAARAKRLSYVHYAAYRRLGGNISIRRAQFELAMRGNTAMLIWLGKNLLGQHN